MVIFHIGSLVKPDLIPQVALIVWRLYVIPQKESGLLACSNIYMLIKWALCIFYEVHFNTNQHIYMGIGRG